MESQNLGKKVTVHLIQEALICSFSFLFYELKSNGQSYEVIRQHLLQAMHHKENYKLLSLPSLDFFVVKRIINVKLRTIDSKTCILFLCSGIGVAGNYGHNIHAHYFHIG